MQCTTAHGSVPCMQLARGVRAVTAQTRRPEHLIIVDDAGPVPVPHPVREWPAPTTPTPTHLAAGSCPPTWATDPCPLPTDHPSPASGRPPYSHTSAFGVPGLVSDGSFQQPSAFLQAFKSSQPCLPALPLPSLFTPGHTPECKGDMGRGGVCEMGAVGAPATHQELQGWVGAGGSSAGSSRLPQEEAVRAAMAAAAAAGIEVQVGDVPACDCCHCHHSNGHKKGPWCHKAWVQYQHLPHGPVV
ncbi:hypothetical protein V8C86DRAFT_1611694 [Haematococcus lacustris]